MKSNVLSSALQSHAGCAEKDGVFQAKGSDLTLYVTLGDSLLPIERVDWVKIEDEAVVVQTRADRYVFAHEDIRGLRAARGDHGLGYSV